MVNSIGTVEGSLSESNLRRLLTEEEAFLEGKALQVRKLLMHALSKATSGHPGASLSCVEILTALYFSELRHDPSNPLWEERDRLVLSKGHAAPALYAVLAECGYFDKSELATLRKKDSRLQGHPELRLPGVDANYGSLGHGLSIVNGIALGLKLKGLSKPRVFCILGDGETDEGQVWEAASTSSHYSLGNVVAIVDSNGFQMDGETGKIMNKRSLAEKFRAFGWNSIEINGHDFKQLLLALGSAGGNKPTALIARTVKGRGISLLEGNSSLHNGMGIEQWQKVLDELEKKQGWSDAKIKKIGRLELQEE
jgi:transketolase